ncbi:hypothetical protein DWB61_08995 [Ancylomarina euxinus]|uniref:Uncharacterized protein n=1 Tax=Ancylomarina euxinus TaxID=2283627 RepID=A0A425Y1S0_9BACT|nr:hypothetical protein DWB61_08995 [Ancylomarina euxinus]
MKNPLILTNEAFSVVYECLQFLVSSLNYLFFNFDSDSVLKILFSVFIYRGCELIFSVVQVFVAL